MERAKRPVSIALFALVGIASTAPAARDRPSFPPREALPALADSLHSLLDGKTVLAPDGRHEPLVGGEVPLLTRERLVTCLESISETGAWPAAWILIQDEARAYDVALPIRLDARGRIELVDAPFGLARREWSAGAIEKAFRQASGRRPPRLPNLVVQSFARRETIRYVYTPPAGGEQRRGLMALLPEGSLLREAHSVPLGDGKLHTLALVLSGASFEPAACSGGRDEVLGHADRGELAAVLAGEQALEDRLDLTPMLLSSGKQLLLPRYACEPGDERKGEAARPPEERFRGRQAVRLLALEDLDGDGRALEAAFTFGIEFGTGEVELRRAVLAVDPRECKLRLLSVSRP